MQNIFTKNKKAVKAFVALLLIALMVIAYTLNTAVQAVTLSYGNSPYENGDISCEYVSKIGIGGDGNDAVKCTKHDTKVTVQFRQMQFKCKKSFSKKKVTMKVKTSEGSISGSDTKSETLSCTPSGGAAGNGWYGPGGHGSWTTITFKRKHSAYDGNFTLYYDGPGDNDSVGYKISVPKLASYDVVYKGNGNTGGSTASQTKWYDENLTLKSCGFTKTGYKFTKWNTKANGSGTNYSAGGTYKKNADLTLYAQWSILSYKLTANANGGSISSTTGWTGTGASATKTLNYNAAYGTLPSVKRTGYTLNGWYTAASGGTAVTSTTKMGAADKTIHAQWTPISYNIAYNANGGSGTMANTSATYGSNVTLRSNSFTKTGYTFLGWNTRANGSGTNYADRASVKNLTTTSGATVTLYAQWGSNPYTVQFDKNMPEATGTMSNQTISTGTETKLSPNQFECEGYEFTGWNTAANGSGTSYTDEQRVLNIASPGQTIKLYAQWKKKAQEELGNDGILFSAYIGVPVRENVKATLYEDGTLIITGEGDANMNYFWNELWSESGSGGTDTTAAILKKNVKKVEIEDTVKPTSLSGNNVNASGNPVPENTGGTGGWFDGCVALTTVDADQNVFSDLVDAKYAFHDCNSLKQVIDLEAANGLKDMTSMYENCYNLSGAQILNLNMTNESSDDDVISGDLPIGQDSATVNLVTTNAFKNAATAGNAVYVLTPSAAASQALVESKGNPNSHVIYLGGESKLSDLTAKAASNIPIRAEDDLSEQDKYGPDDFMIIQTIIQSRNGGYSRVHAETGLDVNTTEVDNDEPAVDGEKRIEFLDITDPSNPTEYYPTEEGERTIKITASPAMFGLTADEVLHDDTILAELKSRIANGGFTDDCIVEIADNGDIIFTIKANARLVEIDDAWNDLTVVDFEKKTQDSPLKIRIQIKKVDADTGKPIAGAKFKIVTNYNIYRAGQLRDEEEDDATALFKAGDTIATAISDNEGYVTFDQDFPTDLWTYYPNETMNMYTISEIESPDGYELSDAVVNISGRANYSTLSFDTKEGVDKQVTDDGTIYGDTVTVRRTGNVREIIFYGEPEGNEDASGAAKQKEIVEDSDHEYNTTVSDAAETGASGDSGSGSGSGGTTQVTENFHDDSSVTLSQTPKAGTEIRVDGYFYAEMSGLDDMQVWDTFTAGTAGTASPHDFADYIYDGNKTITCGEPDEYGEVTIRKVTYTVEGSGSGSGAASGNIVAKQNELTEFGDPSKDYITLKKVWRDTHTDREEYRPSKLTVYVYKQDKDENDNPIKGEMVGNPNGYILNEANNWTVECPDIPKTSGGKVIEYIAEEKTDDGDGDLSEYTMSQDYKNGVLTITNSTGKTEIEVRKIWDDSDDALGLRPSEITFFLQSREKEGRKDWENADSLTLTVDDEKTIKDVKTWVGYFNNLPTEDEAGDELEYRVKEEKLDIITGLKTSGYIVQEDDDKFDTEGIVTFTNVLKIPPMPYHVKKTWEGGDAETSVRVGFFKEIDGEVTEIPDERATLTAPKWEYTTSADNTPSGEKGKYYDFEIVNGEYKTVKYYFRELDENGEPIEDGGTLKTTAATWEAEYDESVAANTAIKNRKTDEYGGIKLTKKGSDTLENLAGAVFTVYEDTNGNGSYNEGVDKKVAKAFSLEDNGSYYEVDSDGKMTEVSPGEHEMMWLPLGTYFVRETKAPKGYALDDITYKAVISEGGEIVNVHDILADCVYNDSMTNLPSLGSMGLLKVVLLAAGFCLAGFLVARRKKNEKTAEDLAE